MTHLHDPNTSDPYMRVFLRILGVGETRRELLWLRAKSKEDEHEARSLLETDPGIRERLAALHDLEAPEALFGRARREAFAALWDAHYVCLERRFAEA